jgi:FkbM family methyltransferase
MSEFNTDWISEYIPDKKTYIIFDIGSHDFQDSINFSRVNPNYKVYGIEADPKNFVNFSKNAELAGVSVSNYAFSDTNGERLFYSSERLNDVEWSPSGSLLKPTDLLKERISFSDWIIIKTKRFDTFCEEQNIPHVHVVHMDVQGAEHLVLNGFGLYRPEIIYCETCEYPNYEGSENLNYLLNILDDMGYRVEKKLTYDTLFILK